MKAISLVLISLASLMGAQREPVSSIDFAAALRVPSHHLFAAIGALEAIPAGLVVSHGGGCDGYDPGIARADRTGANITRSDLPAPYRQGGDVIPMPDGSWWLQTSSGPGFPGLMPCFPPGAPPMHGGTLPTDSRQFRTASAGPGGSAGIPVQNFDHIASNGERIESFREFGASVRIIPGIKEIALASVGLVRVGHVAGGAFVSDREWHITGGYVVVPLYGNRFGVVNRMTGEFNVIDPSTADTRMVETHITSKNWRSRSLIAGANDSIWFLVPESGDMRDLVQFAADGKVVSRNRLHLAAGFRPLKLAISGRDAYMAGFSATVYRYELPQ